MRHERAGTVIANVQPVPIDQLEAEIHASQIDTSAFWGRAAAHLLLSLVLIDVLTGAEGGLCGLILAVAAPGGIPSPKLLWLVFALQLCLILAGGRLLYFTPRRMGPSGLLPVAAGVLGAGALTVIISVLRGDLVGADTHAQAIDARTLAGFATLEYLIVLPMIPGAAFLASRSLHAARFLRIIAPSSGVLSPFQAWDFVGVAARPVFARIDRGVFPQLVVLGRNEEHGFELLEDDAELSLMERDYVALDLTTLQGIIGTEPSEMTDPGRFFRAEVRFFTQVRSRGLLDAALAQLSEDAVRTIRDTFFLNRSLRQMLEEVFRHTLTDYVAAQGRTAMDFKDNFLQAMQQSRAKAEVFGRRLVDSDFDWEVVGRSSLFDEAREFTERVDGLNAQWTMNFRTRIEAAFAELPKAFRVRLREAILRGGGARELESAARRSLADAVDRLIECVGISLIVDDFDFAPGAATDCETMRETMNAELAARQAQVEQAVREAQAAARAHYHHLDTERMRGLQQFIQQAGMIFVHCPEILDRVLSSLDRGDSTRPSGDPEFKVFPGGRTNGGRSQRSGNQ